MNAPRLNNFCLHNLLDCFRNLCRQAAGAPMKKMLDIFPRFEV
jgi:hypothetical protein